MDRDHQISHRQSLALTKAALDRLDQSPTLLNQVLSTLDHWDRVAPLDSKPLRDTWRDILLQRDWSRAMDPGDAGQALRQASPLGKAIDARERLAIIRACKGRNSNT